MKWATRAGCHVDRIGCAWLILRFVDPDALFTFVDDADDVPPDATGFDMRGVDLSHHDGDCSFETILRRHQLDGPVLWDVARIVHEADLADDEAVRLGSAIFDGLFEHRRRALLLGRDPA